jgi:hypothetical protein
VSKDAVARRPRILPLTEIINIEDQIDQSWSRTIRAPRGKSGTRPRAPRTGPCGEHHAIHSRKQSVVGRREPEAAGKRSQQRGHDREPVGRCRAARAGGRRCGDSWTAENERTTWRSFANCVDTPADKLRADFDTNAQLRLSEGKAVLRRFARIVFSNDSHGPEHRQIECFKHLAIFNIKKGFERKKRRDVEELHQ